MIRTYTPDLVFFVERKKNLNTGNTTYKHEVIILNRSNKSVFLYLKLYWNRQVSDLIRTSGISMKPETLRHQVPSSNF